jgi:metallophosphoesterase (TIGR00282 family)
VHHDAAAVLHKSAVTHALGGREVGGQRPAAGQVEAADRLKSPPAKPADGTVRVLMIGDVIGKTGRGALHEVLPALRADRHIDLVTANGENLAGGMGLTASTAAALYEAGVDVITSGNHIWDKRDYPELDRDERILRPLNYGTDGVPGRGWGIFRAGGTEVAVINAQGRTYMAQIENPFTMLDELLDQAAVELPAVRVVDFHCELTSEKNAFGVYLDGRVSAVCGTHTHVATADERILPRRTAYITDIGMTGAAYSVIGFDPATVIPRFINALPTRFEVAGGPVVFNAVQIDIDRATGAASAIARITRMVDQ